MAAGARCPKDPSRHASKIRAKQRMRAMADDVDLIAAVEGHDGIFVIRGGENCRDWNNIHDKVGLSGKNVGARQPSMNVATIPPGGGVAYAHIHVGFEVSSTITG